MNSAALWPIMTMVACGPRLVMVGSTEPSATHSPSMRRTRHRGSTTAVSSPSGAHPAIRTGAARSTTRSEAGPARRRVRARVRFRPHSVSTSAGLAVVPVLDDRGRIEGRLTPPDPPSGPRLHQGDPHVWLVPRNGLPGRGPSRRNPLCTAVFSTVRCVSTASSCGRPGSGSSPPAVPAPGGPPTRPRRVGRLPPHSQGLSTLL